MRCGWYPCKGHKNSTGHEGREMRAVILAAGMGMRLADITRQVPKCLLKINGKSIIESQIDALVEYGINDIIVVVGYQADKVIEKLSDRAKYLRNEIFHETNNSYSIWCVRHFLSDGWLHINCNFLFSPTIMEIYFLSF